MKQLGKLRFLLKNVFLKRNLTLYLLSFCSLQFIYLNYVEKRELFHLMSGQFNGKINVELNLCMDVYTKKLIVLQHCLGFEPLAQQKNGGRF